MNSSARVCLIDAVLDWSEAIHDDEIRALQMTMLDQLQHLLTVHPLAFVRLPRSCLVSIHPHARENLAFFTEIARRSTQDLLPKL